MKNKTVILSIIGLVSIVVVGILGYCATHLDKGINLDSFDLDDEDDYF